MPAASDLRAYFCMVDALRAGRKARLAIVSFTIEGDPIVTYVFVNGRRRPVLVVVDATRDDFGPRVWTQRRCRRVSLREGELTLGGCETVRRGKPAWLRPIAVRG
jgi:riboflavin biosynthesis pyrimidine reductase